VEFGINPQRAGLPLSEDFVFPEGQEETDHFLKILYFRKVKKKQMLSRLLFNDVLARSVVPLP